MNATATVAAETHVIYASAADVAGFIRADLKAAFAGIKFSVRSKTYSGGSSVSVHWTDGPTEDAVNAVIGRYKAQGFDGMTDSSTNSGPVQLANGTWVKIYSYVNTTRTHSTELRARVEGWFDRHFDGGYYADRDTAIWRRLRLAYIVNGCLVVGRY